MSPKDGNPLCCVRAPKTDLGCYYHLVVIGAYCRKSILKQNKTRQSKTEIFKTSLPTLLLGRNDLDKGKAQSRAEMTSLKEKLNLV